MTKFFAYKIGMQAMYTPDGQRVGATVLSLPELSSLDNRVTEKHGYEALRVQFKNIFGKNIIRESRLNSGLFNLENLAVGDLLKASAVSKGKGFAGGVKRHGFAGGPRTHGQSDRERAPGGSSSGTTLGRLQKGKRMAGRMGGERITMRNLQVLEINPEKRQIIVKGSIPGPKSALITLVTTKE